MAIINILQQISANIAAVYLILTIRRAVWRHARSRWQFMRRPGYALLGYVAACSAVEAQKLVPVNQAQSRSFGPTSFQSGVIADSIPFGELFYMMGKLNDDLEPTVATRSPTD
ncbi:MAG: hypothetical protein HON77_09845 [Gammaproteobacteria bacterium]|nr:hypothetical protein [Gammaproteobacteria bacterium]